MFIVRLCYQALAVKNFYRIASFNTSLTQFSYTHEMNDSRTQGTIERSLIPSYILELESSKTKISCAPAL